jgi:peroxiredoxin
VNFAGPQQTMPETAVVSCPLPRHYVTRDEHQEHEPSTVRRTKTMIDTRDLADDDRRVGRFVAAITILITLAAPVMASIAPDFALRSVAGANHRLSEHRGEVVALVFWASWCGGCRPELERFEKLRKTYSPAGLVVLSVSLDEEPARAATIAAAAGIDYPVLLDAGKKVSRIYEAENLPLIILIDRNGVIRARYDALDEREERGLLVQLRDLIDE